MHRARRELLACALVLAAGARVAVAEPPLVIIDPGHAPSHPGATGVRGTPEVLYNDAFAAVLAEKLRRAGFRTALTRAPGEERDLEERTVRARVEGASLLLSVHHDSAQRNLLAQEDRAGTPAFRATRPIRGYSLFISRLNPHRDASRRIADALGRRLLALGRPPTLHHAEAIPGEARPLLDARLGIYQFDELVVLARAPCPAVLLEVGVIVDEVDEAHVTAPSRRDAIADAVVQALLDAREE